MGASVCLEIEIKEKTYKNSLDPAWVTAFAIIKKDLLLYTEGREPFCAIASYDIYGFKKSADSGVAVF